MKQHNINYFPDNDFTISSENDELIKQLLIQLKNDYCILNTCRIKETWLKNHNVYNYLINRYKDVDNIQEILYLLFHNHKEKPQVLYCKKCGKPIEVKFKGFLLGYNLYCSYKCSLNDISNISEKPKVDDQEILNHCIDKNGNLISTYISVLHLKKYGYYNYLINRYNDNSENTIQEIIYRIKNNINVIPKCPICGKPVKFRRFHEGYRKYCSNECALQSEDRKDKVRQSRIKTHDNIWEIKGFNLKTDGDNFIVYDQCKKHNPFIIKKQCFYNRYNENSLVLCPICNPERNKETSIETIIKDLLDEINIEYKQHYRLPGNKELDFYIELDNKKIGIECNGIYWHSGLEGKLKAIIKYNLCKDLNIKLFTFWEDDIKYNIEPIKNLLYSNLGKNKIIYARKCAIKKITPTEAKSFLNKYHLQGAVNASVKLGLFYNDELLLVMTFGKQRIMMKYKDKSEFIWELYRLCSKTGYTIIGGASKLFCYFKKNYNWQTIITYCHNEISNGDIYNKLGFSFNKESGQGFSYYNYKISNRRISRFNLRKDKINDFSGDTADLILSKQGYLKCYDAGVKKYVFVKN